MRLALQTGGAHALQPRPPKSKFLSADWFSDRIGGFPGGEAQGTVGQTAHLRQCGMRSRDFTVAHRHSPHTAERLRPDFIAAV